MFASQDCCVEYFAAAAAAAVPEIE